MRRRSTPGTKARHRRTWRRRRPDERGDVNGRQLEGLEACRRALTAREHTNHPQVWRRYLYSTNHKDIGTMYLVFALMGGLVGGVLSIGMRLELMHPGLQFFHDAHMFNVFTTAHGLIMIFFMVMPAMIG